MASTWQKVLHLLFPFLYRSMKEEKMVIKVINIALAQIQKMGKSLIDSKAFFCLL